MSDTLSMVVCSGTDDRLEAAAILIGGAAAIGRPVTLVVDDAHRADESSLGLLALLTGGSPGSCAVVLCHRTEVVHRPHSLALGPAQELTQGSTTDTLYMAAVNSALASTSALDIWEISGVPGGSALRSSA